MVRWEDREKLLPLICSRELLTQECNSAFGSEEEADEEVTQVLDFYARIFTELLAVPVHKV